MATLSRAQRLSDIEKNLASLQKSTSDPSTTDEQLQMIDNRLAYLAQDIHLEDKKREIFEKLLEDGERKREKKRRREARKLAKESKLHAGEVSAVKAEVDVMEGIIQSSASVERGRSLEKIEDLETEDVDLQHVKKMKLRFKKEKKATVNIEGLNQVTLEHLIAK
ncbi:hypothetical protein IFR05_008426 [Cadophora sp. M221]|nr:hypothetical protein IFR05_008426 [Cadophora sp. M221]